MLFEYLPIGFAGFSGRTVSEDWVEESSKMGFLWSDDFLGFWGEDGLFGSFGLWGSVWVIFVGGMEWL